MSDPTATLTPSVDVDYLRAIGAQIAQIDEKIAAVSGSEAAVRNSVLTTIATENASAVDSIFDQFMNTFRTLPIEVVVGFYHNFEDKVTEDLGAQIDQYVDSRVKQISESVKDDIEPLKEQRKAQLEIFLAMRKVLETIGHDVSSVPVPKRSGGRPAGKSGKSTKKTGLNKQMYRFYIDDAARPPSQNDLSSLAFYSTMGCVKVDDQTYPTEEARAARAEQLSKEPERWGVAEFKAYVASQGVTIGAPGEGDDNWAVTLPNGKVVKARRLDKDNPEDAEIFAKAKEAESGSTSDGDDDSEDEAPTPEPSPDAPVEQPAVEVPQV